MCQTMILENAMEGSSAAGGGKLTIFELHFGSDSTHFSMEPVLRNVMEVPSA